MKGCFKQKMGDIHPPTHTQNHPVFMFSLLAIFFSFLLPDDEEEVVQGVAFVTIGVH